MKANSTSIKKVEPQLLLCPYCKKSIPIITFIPSNNCFLLRIRCICLRGEERTIGLKDFIDEQSSPYTLNQPDITEHQSLSFSTQCLKHNRAYVSYCYECTVNLCEQCRQEEHTGVDKLHRVIRIETISSMKTTEEVATMSDSIIKSSQSKTEAFLDKISNETHQPHLSKMKKKLLRSLAFNVKTNKHLVLFYHLLYSTAHSFNLHLVYQISFLVNSLFILDGLMPIGKTTEEKYSILQNFLQCNLVLKQNRTYKCIAQIKKNASTNLIGLTKGRFAYSYYNRIEIYSSTTFECITTVNCNEEITSLIQLKDERLALSKKDMRIHLLSLTSFRGIALSKGIGTSVESLLELSKSRLASGHEKNRVIIWSLTSLEPICELKVSEGYCAHYMIELKNEWIVFPSDHRINLWDYSSKCSELTEVIPREGAVYCLLLLQNGDFALGDSQGLIDFCDYSNGYFCYATIWAHFEPVFSLAQLPNRNIVSGSRDMRIMIWNYYTYECIETLLPMMTVPSLLLLPEGRLVSGSPNYITFIWDINNKA